MSDRETLDVYDAKAGDYAKRFGQPKPSVDLKAFMARLPANAHVLDLGCGPAQASAHMRAAGHRPDPVDGSAQMVAMANESFDIGARLGTFDDIPQEPTYDGIWASFCLLHAPRDKVAGYIEDCANALHPGGAFYLGMKLGTGSARDKIGRLYCYFSMEELRGFLTDAGLTVLTDRTGAEPGLDGTIAPFGTLLARKDA